MSAPLLGREQILGVLRDLAEELARQGVRAEVFLVGGAAMTLAYDTRRATRDVDAIFEPKQTVYAAAMTSPTTPVVPPETAGPASTASMAR